MPQPEPAPMTTGAAATYRHPSRTRKLLLSVASLAALGALAGCAGGSPSAVAPSAAPSSASATPTSPDVHAAPGKGVEDLPVTAALSADLQSAAARYKHVPAADYSGLLKGATYYAYDAATRTYWAGAGLVPEPDSTAAGVSVQDNGWYDVFRRSYGGRWQVHDVGLAGTSGSVGPCPVTIPAAVLRAWNWPAGSCRPARIS